jgi:Methyltransferase domain
MPATDIRHRITIDGLTWWVAVHADIRPSTSAQAIRYLIRRMRIASKSARAFGVPGQGSFEGVTHGPNHDGVIAILTDTERQDCEVLVAAIANETGLPPATAERIVDIAFGYLTEQIAGAGHVATEGLGTFHAVPKGPYSRGITALLADPNDTPLTRQCPVCEREGAYFLPFGLRTRPRRSGACCPTCGSLERHRTIWRFFHERTNLFNASHKLMLHLAPEPALGSRLRQHPAIGYVSADIAMPGVGVHTDATNICFPDAAFDVIYCSHVLEHIPDDRKAMREFRRVLKPGGWAVLQVPIIRAVTVEDPTVVTWEERARRFGQGDHVRAYGPDYVDRLREAGFDVVVDEFASTLDRRYGGSPSERIYYCSKPNAANGSV